MEQLVCGGDPYRQDSYMMLFLGRMGTPPGPSGAKHPFDFFADCNFELCCFILVYNFFCLFFSKKFIHGQYSL
jgi:hypothetical protein